MGYDYLVQRRQNKTLAKAKQTNKIVSALFPSNVRDRLLQDAEEQAELEMKEKDQKSKYAFREHQKDQLKNFIDEENNYITQPYKTKPIADLFVSENDLVGDVELVPHSHTFLTTAFDSQPSATVMFADIVGFTAWSSEREPSQVFMLLETVYHAFDQIAQRRRVFKVETVGDCCKSYRLVTSINLARTPVSHIVLGLVSLLRRCCCCRVAGTPP